MTKQLLFAEGDYKIWKEQGISPEAFSFLDNMHWGNEGAVYEHKNTKEHIQLIPNPTLLSVTENDKILMTAVFCNTPVSSKHTSYSCYYIRYFAASREVRGKGLTKHFSGKVMEVIRQNETGKTIYFACIERGNRASYKVVESAGYKNIGTVKTIGFSRFFPKAKNIEQINTEAGRKEVLNLLKENYEGHALVQFNSLFIKNNYFVIRENNEIVAGCQYHRAHWIINNMAGVSGKLIMNVVPHIPLLKQLFNPEKFEFLAFEGIYFKQGNEHRLTELFEGLLYREQLKSAMFWMGDQSPFYKQIIKKARLGLLYSFIKDSDVYILAAFQNMTQSEIAAINTSPLYASAFDYL
jgi:hypothetical protein